MVRIGALVAVVALAVMLGLTGLRTFGPEEVVVPTGGVIGGGEAYQDTVPSGDEASAVLADRARLQGWRGDTGPSPATNTPAGRDQAKTPPAGGRPTPTEGTVEVQGLLDDGNDFDVVRSRSEVEGVSAYADPRAGLFERAANRDWRRLKNEEIYYGGGWVIFGFSLLLALFLLFRGRIPLEKGFSGKRVERFNAFERGNHWFTATAFIFLALTGLLLLYGQSFIKPLMSAQLYGEVLQAGAYIHIAFAACFAIGILTMLFMWVHQNIANGRDMVWLKKAGGFLPGTEAPPVGRFNFGQKMIFWAVVLLGGLMVLTGLNLMFPFFVFGQGPMQWSLLAHGAIGLVLIAVIIGHIYIGTVGMVGAFDAMWDGTVDRNWADEHHAKWLAEKEGRSVADVDRERGFGELSNLPREPSRGHHQPAQ